MTGAPKTNGFGAKAGRWLLTAAVVLGGVGYVFRHSLLPSEQVTEVQVESAHDIPMAVTVVTAESAKISRRVVAGGTLIPREEILVAAQVSGLRVESVLADVGDLVEAGEPLAVLDGRRLDILMAQNAADYAKAEAVVAQTRALAAEADATTRESQSALDRATALQARDAISAQSLDERKTGLTTSTARAEAQKQALLAAEADLLRVAAERDELLWQRDQLTVRALAAGIITQRTAQVGQTTGGDGSPLFRIMKDGEVELLAAVVETALTVIRPGQTVTVSVASLGHLVEGRVRLVAPAIDPATRMGTVWISLPGSTLNPGSFASATFETGQRDAILLPHAAVQAGIAGSSVQVVSDGVVSLRQVETGLSTIGGIEITSGINPGDVVVASAGGFLHEGSHVSPVMAVSPAYSGDL